MAHVTLTWRGRAGRVFGPAAELACPDLARQFRTRFVAEDDRARVRLLRRHLAHARGVQAIAYPDVEGEAMHVFLDLGPTALPLFPAARPVFACVVSARSRVAREVQAGRVVVEDVSLQVAASDRLTPRVVANALRRWLARCFDAHCAVRVWPHTALRAAD